jgi:hypothetical protein
LPYSPECVEEEFSEVRHAEEQVGRSVIPQPYGVLICG